MPKAKKSRNVEAALAAERAEALNDRRSGKIISGKRSASEILEGGARTHNPPICDPFISPIEQDPKSLVEALQPVFYLLAFD